MLSGIDQNQINAWKSSLYQYEKNKRTKHPFGKDSSIYDIKVVSSSQVKEKEREFDPLLQKYNKDLLEKKAEKIEEIKLSNYLKNVKSNNDYDIVNLHPLKNQEINTDKNYDLWSKNKNQNNPIRNLYNIINNQSVPSSYFKNRNIKVEERQDSKKICSQKRKQPDFDFVKGKYLQNNEQKWEKQKSVSISKIKQKLNKSHQFDNIYQRYYNPDLQETYNSQLYKSQLVHGRDYLQKLPPSYRDRQPLILNFSEEKSVPALRRIVQRQQNLLRKNQLRYLIEEEYRKRNEEEFQKKQKIIKNKVHDGKIMENMTKQFNIISNKLHQMDKSHCYEKDVQKNPYSYDFLNKNHIPLNRSTPKNIIGNYQSNQSWQNSPQAQSARSNSSVYSRRFSIKSGGFS